jgi:nitroreductase
MIKDIVTRNRSYRRFYQDFKIEINTLRELVELARLSASAANAQPLKYILSCDTAKNALIFPHLAWALFLEGRGVPQEGERPSAYILILCDKEISQSPGCDHGIAAQNILLGAVEMGLGGCMIGAVKRKELSQTLQIPARFEVLLVLAIGKPKEMVVLEAVKSDGSTKYWRDAQQVHHVPKRALADIILT